MIGDKITINGQEWEETYYSKSPEMRIDFDTKDKKIIKCYKKVIKEVFPKVFEGDCYNFRINSEGYMEIINRGGINEPIWFCYNKTFEALKQALAFRDKILEEKK